MPKVATVPGTRFSAVKTFSIASVSTDSRATQKSLGKIVTRQEGDLTATDSTAAAVDNDVGTPRSEINRLAGCVNHKGPTQMLRSPSRASAVPWLGMLSSSREATLGEGIPF